METINEIGELQEKETNLLPVIEETKTLLLPLLRESLKDYSK